MPPGTTSKKLRFCTRAFFLYREFFYKTFYEDCGIVAAMESPVQILYEDKYIVVINKSCNLLSVPFPGSTSKNALDILHELRRRRGLVHGSFKPYAVHRLDRETSGVMMFALTQDARQKIMNSWQTMVTKRCYHALAETPQGRNGKNLADSGVIDNPLAKNAAHHSYVSEHGSKKGAVQDAVTHYRILKRGQKYTLFELELETGRTNQIRAHLAYCGYPLAGDKLYRAKTDPFKRLCLHARSLEFVHPYTKEKLSFEVPEDPRWISSIN